jgi:hypothetical protein
LPTCSSSEGFTQLHFFACGLRYSALRSGDQLRLRSVGSWICREGLVCEDDATPLIGRARVASPCAFSLSSAEDRVRVCGSRLSVWRRNQPTDFGELSIVLFGALLRISPSCLQAGTLIQLPHRRVHSSTLFFQFATLLSLTDMIEQNRISSFPVGLCCLMLLKE